MKMTLNTVKPMIQEGAQKVANVAKEGAKIVADHKKEVLVGTGALLAGAVGADAANLDIIG